MRRSLGLALLLALSPLAVDSGGAQTAKSKNAAPKASTFSRDAERQKVNENLLVLMSGGLGGPYLQLANDIAVATNDGDSLRVLPVISSGSVSNVRTSSLPREWTSASARSRS